jgi:Lar family restriction alleviation protein
MSRSEEVELLGCPFCGGAAEIERYGDARQSTIYVCTECGARLETGETWAHGTRWNTRAPSALPVGWKLVPVEPTEEMIEAMNEGFRSKSRTAAGGMSVESQWRREYAPELAAYRAGLSASPPLDTVKEKT